MKKLLSFFSKIGLWARRTTPEIRILVKFILWWARLSKKRRVRLKAWVNFSNSEAILSPCIIFFHQYFVRNLFGRMARVIKYDQNQIENRSLSSCQCLSILTFWVFKVSLNMQISAKCKGSLLDYLKKKLRIVRSFVWKAWTVLSLNQVSFTINIVINSVISLPTIISI